MPIFEYLCKECHREFETLVQGDGQVACPFCESEDLERKFSAFAVLANSAMPRCEGEGPCAACCDGRGPDKCPLN